MPTPSLVKVGHIFFVSCNGAKNKRTDRKDIAGTSFLPIQKGMYAKKGSKVKALCIFILGTSQEKLALPSG